MIGSIGTNTNTASIFTQVTASAAPIAEDSYSMEKGWAPGYMSPTWKANQLRNPVVAQKEAQLATLTPDDWATVSIAIGKKIDFNSPDRLPGGAPAIAFEIMHARQSGEIRGPSTSMSFWGSRIASLSGIEVDDGDVMQQQYSRILDWMKAGKPMHELDPYGWLDRPRTNTGA